MNEQWAWPFLDIQQAIHDCQRNLEDVIRYAEVLMEDQTHPLALRILRDRARRLKVDVYDMLSPEIATCIREEQAAYDEEEGRWEAHRANNYLP
jgi:hypothetical protein